jgi:RimJ/RimL family protein N-acetyltransferase
MIEIKPVQVTPQFRSLFNATVPAGLRCFAVLGGGNAGRIFTDDQDHPQTGYVWERDDGTLYQGGVQNDQTLCQMVELLRQEGTVALGFRDGDPAVEHFPPNPEAGAECVELYRPARGSDLSPFLELPAGYEAHRMTRELHEKSPRLEAILFRYGNLDQYLETGLDVCILHGDEYVCEAGADMDVAGAREVGLYTEQKFRRNGFGTIAVAHLLKWCDELGCSTYWNCVKLNIGSLKIARKLGFVNERNCKLLAWFPPNRKVGMR